MLFFAAGNFAQNVFANTSENSKTAPPLFGFSWFLICGTGYSLYLLISRDFVFHPLTILTALCAGASFCLGSYTALLAMRTGPLSLTILIASFCVVFPSILSILFLGERLHLMQMLGFMLILAVFVIITGGKKDSKPFSAIWLFTAVLCSASNGMIMFMAKLHQHILPSKQQPQYFALAFLSAAFCSILIYFLNAKQSKVHYAYTYKSFYAPAVATAVTLALGNFSSFALSSVMPASVLFPTMQGGTLLLTTAAACLFFGERPLVRTYASLAIGLVAIVLLNI